MMNCQHICLCLISYQSDEIIGCMSRSELENIDSHNYRVINIFIEDEKGNILLPKRTFDRKKFPGKYDFSVGGYVQSGESYLEAALRETQEELLIDVNEDDLIEIR